MKHDKIKYNFFSFNELTLFSLGKFIPTVKTTNTTNLSKGQTQEYTFPENSKINIIIKIECLF